MNKRLISVLAAAVIGVFFGLMSGTLPNLTIELADKPILEIVLYFGGELGLFILKTAILAYIIAKAWEAWDYGKEGVSVSKNLDSLILERLGNVSLLLGSSSDSANETYGPDLIHESYKSSSSEDAVMVSAVVQELESEIGTESDTISQSARTLVAVCRSFYVGQSIQAAENTLRHQKSDLEAYVGTYFHRLANIKSSLPMIGFAGTILGIMISMGALSGIMKDGMTVNDMAPVIKSLGVAFDTTLIALVASYLLGHSMTDQIKSAENNIDHAVYEVEKQLIPRFKLWLHPEHIQKLVIAITDEIIDEVVDDIGEGFKRSRDRKKGDEISPA